jgi:hypothetical protein
MPHLDEGRLAALLDGEVPRDELDAVQLHLSGCDECQERLAEARRLRDQALELVGVLDQESSTQGGSGPASRSAASAPASGSGPTAGWRRRRRPSWGTGLAWAATLLLALTGGYLLGGANRRAALPALADQPGGEARVLAASESAQPAETDHPDSAGATTPSAPGPAAAAPAPPARRQPAGARTDAAAQPATPRVANELASATPEQEARADRAARPSRPEPKDEVAKAAERPEAAPDAIARLTVRQSVAASRLRDTGAAEAALVAGAAPGPGRTVQLRLITGLIVDRIEQVDSLTRVYYATPFGPLVLEQWRVGSAIRTRLVPPPGVPADSLAAWRERVR